MQGAKQFPTAAGVELWKDEIFAYSEEVCLNSRTNYECVCKMQNRF